jgi:ribosomal protein S18 acetylase RimI-like enzyme
MEPLDNIMWHSLSGPHQRFAQGDDRARRYPSDVAPFGAVPDVPTPEHYEALRDLIGPGEVTSLFRGDVTVPDGWDVLGTIDGVQMTGPTRSADDPLDPRITTLGVGDVEEMVSLTLRTRPGPFAPRALELGTYLGVRIEGQLIAMAGQRARTNDHVEISAVCTDEHHAGQGLGRALVNAQVSLILADGKLPMLHTAASNARAIALYEYLGFRHRRDIHGVVMRSPG